MPEWLVPLLALIALLSTLYIAFVREPAPRSGSDPGRHVDPGASHHLYGD